MPVLVLVTGAVVITLIEYSIQVRSLHETLSLVVLVATMTGGGIVATSRAAWGWWEWWK